MKPITEIDHIDRVMRVVDQMRQEPDRTLSLADIADIAALSPFHLIRVFRLLTGYTPAAMQTALRVQEAKRLLAAEDSTVTDACFAVGFSSLGSFSQRFLYLTGVTPSDYRRSRDRVDDVVHNLSRLTRTPLVEGKETSTVSGRLTCDVATDGFYFVGLFPPGPPIGRPIVGDILREAGEFVIRHVPDGAYAIYSAVVAFPSRSLDWVLPDTEEYTGGGHAVSMVCGLPVSNITIHLNRRERIMTPVMTTLMAIPDIAERGRHNHRTYEPGAAITV